MPKQSHPCARNHYTVSRTGQITEKAECSKEWAKIEARKDAHIAKRQPARPAVFWAGQWLGFVPRKPFSKLWIRRQARWYYSDGLDAYQRLWYHLGRYEVSKGKADIYSVEADNAELRHYLARLARKSRRFSRCPYALECALRLFVHCFNSRQLDKQRFPNYASHLMDFVSPLF
ncbi:MAG: IS1 family transposase [Anaerolineales bacterium]|nr:IS1 family transposase [Anaerolineales bacterium]